MTAINLNKLSFDNPSNPIPISSGSGDAIAIIPRRDALLRCFLLLSFLINLLNRSLFISGAISSPIFSSKNFRIIISPITEPTPPIRAIFIIMYESVNDESIVMPGAIVKKEV